MTRALLLALLALSLPLAAEPLTQADHRIIMAFAQAIGVPTIDGPSSVKYEEMNLMPDRMLRYFPEQITRIPTNRG